MIAGKPYWSIGTYKPGRSLAEGVYRTVNDTIIKIMNDKISDALMQVEFTDELVSQVGHEALIPLMNLWCKETLADAQLMKDPKIGMTIEKMACDLESTALLHLCSSSSSVRSLAADMFRKAAAFESDFEKVCNGLLYF
jgi:hypothetical protein